MLKGLFGVKSDEEHFYLLELNRMLYVPEYNQASNMIGEMFIEHVANKFDDLQSVENLDMQIYYLTQQVRREVAAFHRLRALSHIPKLIQLLNRRK